ncbi:hypothetical protein OSB04_000634 [Centaurea solstitialis]|uniref:Uncharacterized protein n=1 Tax=Centaurea solstitialis TaxID=347529 RepID=A0AA38U8V0_9ASTR|nr:hypothetical protein OSB04_000634 [Centaurea solstitialis]
MGGGGEGSDNGDGDGIIQVCGCRELRYSKFSATLTLGILVNDILSICLCLEAEHTVHLIRGFVPAAPDNNSEGTASTRENITPSVARGVGGSIEEGMMGGDRVSLFSTLGGMSGARLPDLEQMQRLRREINDRLPNNPLRNLNPRNLDPAFLQRLEAARDFERRREANRCIGSDPETVNVLMRMFENIHEPFPNAATMGAQGRHDQLNNPTTAGSETTTGSPAPNTNPLPNPWAAGGGGGGGKLLLMLLIFLFRMLGLLCHVEP